MFKKGDLVRWVYLGKIKQVITVSDTPLVKNRIYTVNDAKVASTHISLIEHPEIFFRKERFELVNRFDKINNIKRRINGKYHSKKNDYDN